jgi:hypothetical protein
MIIIFKRVKLLKGGLNLWMSLNRAFYCRIKLSQAPPTLDRLAINTEP